MGNPTVVLVHGTGASAASPEGPAWWQTRGSLWPKLCAAGLSVEAFIWSGHNSETERRVAGAKLAKHLRSLHSDGCEIHLIGHSHGGSVIWHAIGEVERAVGPIVRSWASVGTPYLHYGIRWPRFWLALLITLAGLVGITLAGLSLKGVEPEFAWRDAAQSIELWLLLLLIPAAAFCWGIWSMLPFLGQLISGSHQDLSPEHKGRFLALWSTQDEPIIGLGASGSFSINFLQERNKSRSALGWLLLPIHPIAAATNQLVNNIVSRGLQGSTIAHLELRATRSYPVVSLAHRALPQKIDSELIQHANQNSGALGMRVRDLLVSARDPITGFSDLQLEASRALTFKELVHTTYFENADCVALILHHVHSNAGGTASNSIEPDLLDWYSHRFDVARAKSREIVLPSNRLSIATAAGASVVTLMVTLATLAQGTLHEKAFAPTTAKYHIQALINQAQISAALSSVAPGERLEEMGSPFTLSIWRVPGEPANAIGSHLNPDLSILRPYIKSVLDADHLESLVHAVNELPSDELRVLFYNFGAPLIAELASRQQLEWFVEKSGLLPGPKVRTVVEANYVEYPVIESIAFRAARRQLLDKSLIDKSLRVCGEINECKDRLKLTIAWALIESGITNSPDFLLPIPKGSVLLDATYSGAQTTKIRIPLLGPLANYGANPKYLAWLARHEAWELLADQATHYDGELQWSDFGDSVRSGLANARGTDVNHVLAFLALRKWDIVPADILEIVEQVRLRQHERKNVAVDPQVVTVAQIDRLKRVEFNKRKCASLSSNVATAAGPISEEPSTDILCFKKTNSARAEERAKRVSSRLEKVARNNVFYGSKGFLDEYSAINLQGLSDDIRLDAAKTLFRAFKRASCAIVDEDEYSVGETDRRLLASALEVLGKPAKEFPEIATQWMKLILSDAPCTNWRKATNEEKESFEQTIVAITFELAVWLNERYPNEALDIMQRISGSSRGPVLGMSIGGVRTAEFVDWFDLNRASVDVLYATAAEPHSFRLKRRTALYRVAACLAQDNKLDRSAAVAGMAAMSGMFPRSFAREEALLMTIAAESGFHAQRFDWRRAAQSCRACDARGSLALAIELLPHLSARIQGRPAPAIDNCEKFSDESYRTFFQSQSQIEERSLQQAKARAQEAMSEAKRRPGFAGE